MSETFEEFCASLGWDGKRPMSVDTIRDIRRNLWRGIPRIEGVFLDATTTPHKLSVLPGGCIVNGNQADVINDSDETMHFAVDGGDGHSDHLSMMERKRSPWVETEGAK